MTAALRKTPTPENIGPATTIGEKAVSRLINTEVEALWRYAAYPLTSVGGTANAVTAASDTAVVSAITAYAKGMKRSIIPALTNTGGLTLSIDAVGVVDWLDADGEAHAEGEIVADRMYGIEFDGTAWRTMAGVAAASSLISNVPDIILRDEKTTGTAGGTASSGGFATRTLDDVVRNVIIGASVASNALTLPPSTGGWFVAWSAPAYKTDRHVSRLYNVTASAVLETGEPANSSAADNVMTRSDGFYVIAPNTTPITIRIEQNFENGRAPDGLGTYSNLGAKEIFTRMHVWKIGALASQVDGIPGGGIVLPYVFSTTTTDADPGGGLLRLNNATQNTATMIYADLLDRLGVTVTSVLDNLDASSSTVKGHLRLTKYDDPTRWLLFTLSARTTATGYRKLTVANVASSAASPFSNGDILLLQFSRAGDVANVDVPNMTEDTAPSSANDFLFSYDASAGGYKKVKPKNLAVVFDAAQGLSAGQQTQALNNIGLSEAAKAVVAWAAVTVSGGVGTITGGFNIASVTRVANGKWYASFTTNVSASNLALVSHQATATNTGKSTAPTFNSRSASRTGDIEFYENDTLTDPAGFFFLILGAP